MQCRRLVVLLAGLLFIGAPLRADSANGEYLLNDFGDVSTPQAIQATVDKAVEQIKARGGGFLIVPPGINPDVDIHNYSETVRVHGTGKPTVTILDRRSGNTKTLVPPIGRWSTSGWWGSLLRRELNIDGPGFSSWGNSQVMGIDNRIVHGTSSYLQPTPLAASKGKDQRVYVYTERGIYVGQYLNYYGGPYYAGGFEPITVKSIGWDAEKKLYYFTADLNLEHNGGFLSNKNMVGSLNIESNQNADNQTAGDVAVVRRQYAHGDSFLIEGQYVYQGDVLTQMGDEGGVIFDAQPQQDPDPFHGTVESIDTANDAVVFQPNCLNVQKLASSRPIINMNPKKWVTAGTVKIVGQDLLGGYMIQDPHYDIADAVKNGIDLKNFKFTFTLKPGEKTGSQYWGGSAAFENLYKAGKPIPSIITWDGHPVKKFKYPYQGRAYPSLHQGGYNHLGGRIIASADCGWTPDVVGRYFAVADDGEVMKSGEKTRGDFSLAPDPKYPSYRWYPITDFWKNADGTCGIHLGRVRMFAGGAGSPNLYNDDNYTWDGHERPLKYIIAPGAMVYDVSKGYKDSYGGGTVKSDPRTIKIAHHAASGTPFDFAPGDPIDQAIGADPAIPLPIRIRLWNNVPDNFESGAVQISNNGKVGVESGMGLYSGTQSLQDVAERKDRKAPFKYALNVDAATHMGIHFAADVTDSAIKFEQPHEHAQPIKWEHANGTTALRVDPITGDMAIIGSKLQVPSVKGTQGISATKLAANNLRGINIVVPARSASLTVRFNTPEPDAEYSLNVQPNWITQDAVISKSAVGFTVRFSAAAPAGAKLDWQLIR